jgi:hypothetical protein
MAIHVPRIALLLSSALVSATVLAAPKPFDTDATFVPGADEEAVLRYVANCSPSATPTLRLCQELPLNLDGQPGIDMLVGVNQTSYKRFYSGRPDGLFNPPAYVGVETPTRGLKLADLDADGDLDMIEAVPADGTTGNNWVYVNRAGTLASLFESGNLQALDSSRHDRSSGVVIGDVNNDNKLDVIITNETPGPQNDPGGETLPYGKTNYLYLNKTTTFNTLVFGSGTDLTVAGPPLALDAPGAETYTRRGVLIDAEGDGDLDLVVTSADNHHDNTGNGNFIYINGTVGGSPAPAAGTNPFAAAIPLTAGTDDDTDVANAIAAGDLDGDGDPDLVFSTWSRLNGTTIVEAMNRYYINTSTAGSFSFESFPFGSPGHHTNLRLGDFDGDADLDLLTTVFGGPNTLHRNTGTAGALFDAGVELVAPAGHDRSRGVDTADLNNDGSLDVVIVNRDQLGLRYLNRCTTAAGCGGGAPFENVVPAITAPQTAALVPPVVQPIDVDDHLDALTVTDRDNVYPADFGALPVAPSGGSQYTCTDGVASAPPAPPAIVGTCVDGRITPTSGAVTAGTIPLQLKVWDGEASSTAFAFTLTVGTGVVPTITTTTLPAATEDAAYTATIEGEDGDGNYPLTFESVNLLPTWLELVPVTTGPTAGRVVTLQSLASALPRQGDVGPHTITMRARDSNGLESAQRSLTLTVNDVNDRPTVTTTTLPNGTQGQAYSATVAGNDEDPSTTLTFAATGLPAGLSINPAGAISGTPTVSGSFPVDLTVSDGTLTSDPVRVTLTIAAVGGPPANTPPTFTAPGPQTGTVGAAYTLSLAGSATDANSDPLTFSATGLPPGITISAAGLLSGSPTTATGSPFTVTVTVDDGKGGQTSGSFQFTVSNPTSGGGGNSGGGSSGGGGSLGFLEVLGLLGLGALGARRRRGATALAKG